MVSNDSTPCCEMSAGQSALVASANFWVQGVATFCVGVFGLVGNFLAISVLVTKDIINAFNGLLVLLALVDSCLIAFAIFDHCIIRAWKVRTFTAFT